ncbi:tyrosine-type recombinase/integrase [Nitrobacter sp.]|uniref:tyrosine-type recombinase/integrase n=1 Tax=Nitrobacter sp. TaxID=29420 RepID=UPI003F64B4F0
MHRIAARLKASAISPCSCSSTIPVPARIKVGDLSGAQGNCVQLTGKGSKTRRCPLWPQTARVLQCLVQDRSPGEHVFLNRLGQPMTRFGIYALVSRTVAQVVKKMPSLKNKRISPHSIRHTSAVHLLRAGVDINTIRAWLAGKGEEYFNKIEACLSWPHLPASR